MKSYRLRLVFAVTCLVALYFPAVHAQGTAMFAVLVGGNEVNAAGLANQGNLRGFGTATLIVNPTPLDPNNEQLCFGVTTRGIDAPTAMHIHTGRAGLAGPVAVPLVPIPVLAGVNAYTSSGCVNASNAVIRSLTYYPANSYVNVHTLLFPAGALRGQLF